MILDQLDFFSLLYLFEQLLYLLIESKPEFILIFFQKHSTIMGFQANFQSSDCSSLGKSILEDQHQGINVDFILSSGGEKVLVHSIMIRNSSPMLKALLHTSCTCSQPNAILLPQEYSSVLSHFVALLYMGSSFLPKNLVPQLKELALLLGIANVSLDHQYENVLGSRWDVSEDEAEDNNISIDEKEGNRPTPMKLST